MDKMREEFEKWFYDNAGLKCKFDSYDNAYVTASRAAMCVELPQQEKVPAEMSMSWQPFYKMMSSDVIKMLDDAGVSYK